MSIRKSVERMTGYTPGEQPGETGVVKLNTNENPYPPSPMVGKALAGLETESLRLYPDPLSKRLRTKIAGIHGCSISQVFAGNGSDEVLALCTRAFVENDGTIGYFEPSYSLYPVLAEIREEERRPIALGPDFEWTMPEQYACSLFFLTNPNAPTGIVYPREIVRDFCEAFDGVVVIDEAYVDFAAGNCMDLAIELDNVLVARTLSKGYSLAGLRVGYAVGAEPLIDALHKVKDSYNLNAVSQQAALAALSDMDHMRSNIEKIRKTRARLSDSLEEMGFAVFPSEANFVWSRPEKVTAEQLFLELKKRKIFIRYFDAPRTADYVRITVGTDEEIDVLLNAVRDILSDV